MKPQRLAAIISYWIVSTMSCLTLISCIGTGPPDGYLSSSDTRVDFVQFTEKDNQLNGHIQEVRITNDVPPKLQTTSIPFTGVQNGSSVTITFTFFWLSVSSVTGTFDGTTLTLAIPQQDGHLENGTFTAASIQDYNQAVDVLQKQIDQQNQQYADGQSTVAANQATASAGQATQTAQQNAQQAVSDANSRLGNALNALKSDVNGLASFSESSTLNGYANDWKSMQKDYATEHQDAQAGCGDNSTNYNQVQADANQVGADENQISADDNQLSADKSQYDTDLSAVQSDVQTVKDAWAQLQQAVTASNTPPAAYSSNDISTALQNAEQAEKAAKDVWQSAQASAAQYDQEASALQKQADALPASMHCN